MDDGSKLFSVVPDNTTREWPGTAAWKVLAEPLGKHFLKQYVSQRGSETFSNGGFQDLAR